MMTFIIVVSLCTFLMVLIGTRLAILALRKRTLPVALRDLRDNVTPTPRGGGLVVAFALIIGLLVGDIGYGIVLSLLLLLAIAELDELIGVPLPVRLLVQVMAVTVPLSIMNVLLFDGALPLWLDRLVAGCLWIAFINLFAAADTTEGICGVGMTAIGGGLALLAVMLGDFPTPLSTHGLIVAAAGCGFLWWNWPRAKILLGPPGSLPIGFLLGYLLLMVVLSGYPYAAAILPGYFLAEGLVTALASLRNHNRKYFHEKALERGHRPQAVLRYVAGLHLLLIFLAIRSVIDPEIAIIHISVAYLCIFMLLGFFAHTKTGHA